MASAKTKREVSTQTEVSPSPITRYEQPFIPVATQVGPPQPVLVNLGTAPYEAVSGNRSNALLRLGLSTALRAGIIGLGLYAVGVRKPKELIVGSLASSSALSLTLMGYHAVRTKRLG